MNPLLIEDEAAMYDLGLNMAQQLSAPFTLHLHGQLGAGKTMLTRAILHGLGYQGRVKSPSFTLVEPYQLDHFTLYHLDLYRLHSSLELENLGIRDLFFKPAIHIIEWPENADNALSKPDLSCHIEWLDEHKRHIQFNAQSTAGSNITKLILTT